MKNNNIVHWTIKIGWEDGTEEYIADIPDWVAKPVDEFLGEIEREKREEEPESVTIIDPSLQAYIDEVALNILYRNYHKSTNGIWSKGEVNDHWEQDGDVPEVYDVIIDFGCQDDTRNESYREEWYFFKKDGEWTCDDVSPIDTDWLKEDPADKDDRLYHEGVDIEAMDKAKESKQ